MVATHEIESSSGSDGDDSLSLIRENSHEEDDSQSSIGSNASAVDEPPIGKPTVERAAFEAQLVVKETNRVRTLRTILLIVLVVVGAVMTTATYLFLTRQQQATTKTTFHLFTASVQDTTRFRLANTFQAVRGMSRFLTTTARSSNDSFPFLMVSSFELQGSHVRQQSGMEAIAFMPLVETNQRQAWLDFSTRHQDWIEFSRTLTLLRSNTTQTLASGNYTADPITPELWYNITNPTMVPGNASGPFLPIGQQSPPPFNNAFVNFDTLSLDYVQRMLSTLVVVKEGVFSEVLDLSGLSGTGVHPVAHRAFHAALLGVSPDDLKIPEVYDHPHSLLLEPVFSKWGDPNAGLVGVLGGVVPWDGFVSSVLPIGVTGVHCVLVNTCGQSYTYLLNGPQSIFLGSGDLHDQLYDDTQTIVPLEQYNNTALVETAAGHCRYQLHLYATSSFQTGQSSQVVTFTWVVGAIFVLIIITFLAYDRLVWRRNQKLLSAAVRAKQMLASLFPQNVADRLFNEHGDHSTGSRSGASFSRSHSFNHGSMANLGKDVHADFGYDNRPIADFFPETTVMYADIAGFTAWSSVREPSQVFALLEAVYKTFDELANRRQVFKVETVGDCYVAVTGLPESRRDHAIAMARFARDCIVHMRVMTKQLEITLGPDTGDLHIRIGMHSGPVTAGVLRGARSRFQLFGDTVAMASRMERTGEKGRIHISQETAELLIGGGRGEWVKLREGKVAVNEAGDVHQTYWLSLQPGRRSETSSVPSSNEFQNSMASVHYSEPDEFPLDSDMSAVEAHAKNKARISLAKMNRLIEWNVDVLHRLLRQVVARRSAIGIPPGVSLANERVERKILFSNGQVIDEVKEIIHLPRFNAQAARRQEDPDAIDIPQTVLNQLYDLVAVIADMYNQNPFHNFEHASHVTMSVVKLLSRIVAPSDLEELGAGKSLHDHTYGITSDPLTQFACVFSALIHDVDHAGVPNAQLVNEGHQLALQYQDKSVAEQNSVDLAWRLLMEPAYRELRNTIYVTEAEFKRFRQLVVNSVMATDIVDKELKALRNARWAKAFSETLSDSDLTPESPQDDVNRKATIVIEHLIQASDVSHTMQHWHIYRKWNERFFLECYQAYREGRAGSHPADSWYQGEIGFFDFYIIPLAKKLKDCGVFGVSSDEYLNYAEKNRREWDERGREVVDEMIQMVRQQELLDFHSSRRGSIASVQ